MNRKWTYLVAALVLGAVAIASSGCEKLRARDQLNKGVQAFKNAKYAESVENFKVAVELDPTFATARLYLATAYMSQYVPGSDSEENLRFATAAKQNFQLVLDRDANNAVALASMASLNYQEAGGVQELDKKFAKLDEARAWYEKLVQVDPKNKEAWYSMGVISWAKWYPALNVARAELGMKPEDPGPLKDKKVREELRTKYSATIEDGIKNLTHALDIDQNYDDAMAYLNLLNRERADLAETPDAYKQDIATADNWLQKALDTRKAKAAAQAAKSGGGAAPAK
jgi:tetratricopeptide (TPR) repeat protein